MARVFRKADAKLLGLPGRCAREILSGESGSHSATLRLVEIAPERPGDPVRGPHFHSDVEECIYVLSGKGTTFAESGEFPLEPGDTVLMPVGERHVTRNTGEEPLVLLCFFPSADIRAGMQENNPSSRTPSKP
jgi:mannose-6-phosphate isomerase-like protein (cupin superfamily)